MNEKEILLASLLGSKIAEQIPRFALVENELQKHVLPAVSLFPFEVGESWNFPTSTPAGRQFFPIKIRRPDDGVWFMLPYEPMLNISGKNNIVKRNVAKRNSLKNDVNKTKYYGTIKEYWSQDDYEITITGALVGAMETGSAENCFPLADFEKLRDYCTLSPKGLEIDCYPLAALGITNIVVESFNFPFTKGENVQAYEIKAVSDGWYDLIITDDRKST